MKHTLLCSLALMLAALPLSSFDSKSLVGHKMPLLSNKTLDGKTIDDDYYKGHVTVVCFMAIGCPPCMNEIGMLNKLNDEYASDGRVQILCVARQMRDQMRQFNEDPRSVFGMLRKAMKAEQIRYAIQPACADGESKMDDNHDSTNRQISLKAECNTLEEKFGVTGVPANFLVDRNGIIRSVHVGGPGEANAMWFHDSLKKSIDSLLVE